MLILQALVAACGGPPGSQPPPQPPEVSVITMAPQPVTLSVELPGRTAPVRIAEIRPQVSGLLLKRHFEEGSDVRAGQLLYEIDPRPFEAALEQARASVVAAQTNAERARAALAASEANVERQRATLRLAQENRQRFEASYQERAVSASQRDEAVTSEQVAEATLRAAEAQVESDRRAIAAAEAAIEQAQAALQAAEINLAYTRITAPINGRIGRSYATEGAMLTAYQPAAMAIIQQMDPMYVDVVQSTAELLRLRERLEQGLLHPDENLQRKVKLRLENGTPYPLEGVFQFRDVSVDPTAGTVVLRMVFPNPDRLLLPDMFVRAVLQEGTNPQAILVPQQAVRRDVRGQPYVLLVDEQETVQVRPLSLDRTIDDRWLVSSGLGPGDRVVMEGLQFVQPGMKVRAVPFETPPPGTQAGSPAPTSSHPAQAD
jgi:membrane fusion protein (multidrug efflux system)